MTSGAFRPILPVVSVGHKSDLHISYLIHPLCCRLTRVTAAGIIVWFSHFFNSYFSCMDGCNQERGARLLIAPIHTHAMEGISNTVLKLVNNLLALHSLSVVNVETYIVTVAYRLPMATFFWRKLSEGSNIVHVICELLSNHEQEPPDQDDELDQTEELKKVWRRRIWDSVHLK